MTAVVLNDDEVSLLVRFDPAADPKIQGFLTDLEQRVGPSTRRLELTDVDLQLIQSFAFESTGGWEIRFRGIFGRTLGSTLGRDVGSSV